MADASAQTTIRASLDDRLADTTIAATTDWTAAHTESGVEVNEPIGAGGMAQVLAGRQRSLQRSVAIKRVLPGRASEQADLVLLREALITGAIEHPNVVPVYDVCRDENGAALMVMKRVHGQPWDEALRDRPAPGDEAAFDRYLDRHVDVLIQVCHAVHYAHSRGIVHLDIKPANVLLGSYGETHLADWGIAAAVGEDPDGRFPRVSQYSGIVGTPAYMAPEMARGDTDSITARTDVYLLGATLYEVLSGMAPHDADTVEDALMSANTAGQDPLPAHVPTGLATVCRRALQLDRDDRYETAAALRLALEDYRRHRASLRLCESADEHLERLQRLIDDGADEAVIDRVFAECRFAFRHARIVWPGNPPARRGLQRVLQVRIDHLLSRGDAAGARRLVSELPDEDPDRAALIEAAEAARAEERAALEAHQQEWDAAIGAKTRQRVLLALAVVWSAQPIVHAVLVDLGLARLDLAARWWTAAAFALFAAGCIVVARRIAVSTAFNRMMLIALTAAAGWIALARLIDALQPIAVQATMVRDLLAFAVINFFAALEVDRRLLIVPVIYVLGALVCVAFPARVLYVNGVSHALALGRIYQVWGASPEGRRPGVRH